MGNNVMFFMTASGILVAVLLVWAQLWITTAQGYKQYGLSTSTVGVSLSYVYGATLTSLIAFATILIQFSVSRFALVFLTFSVILAIILVAGSFYASLTKAISGKDVLAPSNDFASSYEIPLVRIIALIIIPAFLMIFSWLIVCIFPCTKTIFDRLIG